MKRLQFNSVGQTGRSFLLALLAGGSLIPAQLMAQETTLAPEVAAQPTNGDIVVTATLRSQTAQTVPLSLTAVGAEQLTKEGITDATQLPQLAPGLAVTIVEGNTSPRYTVRGVQSADTFASASSPIATYVDDVYQVQLFGITNVFFDVNRVEVLRGPQGTTFGKNATGGAVSYFSQVPTNRAEGFVGGRISGGERPERYLEGVVNVPLVEDKLALRVSLRGTSQSAYTNDTGTGNKFGAADSQYGRVQLRYTPTTDTTINLTGFASRARGDGLVQYADFFGPIDINTVTFNPYDSYQNTDVVGATLRIDQQLGDFSLTSISNYRRTKFDLSIDIDSTPLDIIYYLDTSVTTQYGEELRLASDPDKRLSGLVGLYFLKDKIDNKQVYASTMNASPTSDYNIFSRPLTKTTTLAAFANLKFKVTDALALIGGVRKSRETRNYSNQSDYFVSGQYDWTQANVMYSGAPPATPDQVLAFTQRQKATPWTWDATINYNPSRDFLLFARIAKGYRSGGFNQPELAAPLFGSVVDLVNFPLSPKPSYGPEFIKSYEAGIKTTWLDGALRVNAGIFHYDYNDMQVQFFTGVISTVANAAQSKVDGGEVEVNITPAQGFSLRGSVAYTDARYANYTSNGIDYSGKKLTAVPKWTANLSANYEVPVSASYALRANTTWTYRDRLFYNLSNSPRLTSPSYIKGNVRLALEPISDKGLSVAAFVNNVTNKRPLGGGIDFGYLIKLFDAGRQFGLDVAYHW